jgi:hypothetical protein
LPNKRGLSPLASSGSGAEALYPTVVFVSANYFSYNYATIPKNFVTNILKYHFFYFREVKEGYITRYPQTQIHPDSNDLLSAKLNPRSGGVLVLCAWKQVEVKGNGSGAPLPLGARISLCTFGSTEISIGFSWATGPRFVGELHPSPSPSPTTDSRAPVPFRFAGGRASIGTASSAVDDAPDSRAP